jgi:MGT family glycosyltransferase
MFFREAPQAIQQANIDVLVIDQISTSMATVADYLGLPFITVCNAMLINREPAVPPYSTHWAYSTTPWARLRNRLGNALVDYLTRDLWQVNVEQRREWNLPPYQKRGDAYSPLAQVCQLPEAFDFPREHLPDHFHYIGRFQDPSGTEPISFDNTDFPFERLNGKPLIYASLGTLQNQRPEIFECIAKSCLPLDVQLVISLGNPKAPIIELPGNPIIVPFAPHQKLIERSKVVVTHAGMNTVLTALGCGVPLVAIPITNEQPGIASRLARTKAGKMLKLSQLSEMSLRTAITEVLSESSYRNNAKKMQRIIQELGGVDRVADIIEEAAQTRQPVTGRSGS